MNELFKRAITGFIYIFLLLSAIMLNVDAFDFLFLIFGMICLFEFKKIVRLKGYSIFLTFLFFWWIFMHLKLDPFLIYILLIATILCNIYLTSLLLGNIKENKLPNEYKFLIALFYIGGGSLFLPFIYRFEIHNFEQSEAQITMIGILCIIWASDSFAYLVGKSIGKNKLFERISPKKTIEGFFGGLVGALLTAYLISLYSQKGIWMWLIIASVLVISGTIGDLIESKFKRTAKVKDSGTILPGHGGLLDRLDSLIFASPFAYLTILLIEIF